VRAQPAKTRLIGTLHASSASDPANRRTWQAFVDGLRERGWEEGRNIAFERRFTGPELTRFPELAEELVGLKVEVILSAYTPAIAAARSSTTTIPIVMVGVADPVGSGLVESLARPSGNVTGIANQIETVSAKNFELLKESKPGIKRIGIVFSPDNTPSARTAKAMQEDVGPRLGLTVVPIGVTKAEDLPAAFETIVREQVEAFHVLPVPVAFANRAKIADFATQRRLLTTAPLDTLVRDGLLMSYGFDPRMTWNRAGSYVDRIFKGASPAELPVEQVDRFQLVINQMTARAIGFDAASLLSRADEVIE
jgi:putative ABC transport system substrate-binding protein